MYRRRRSPYSCIREIRESRGELVGLALSTVVLGILLNVVASSVYDTLLAGRLSPRFHWGFLALAAALSLILVALVIWVLYSRRESATVPIEVAIPYHLLDTRQISVPVQHPYRPPYNVASLARQRFMSAFSKNSDAEKQLLEQWRAARAAGIPFQDFFSYWHKALVDCLILDILHGYNDESLGGAAHFTWWQVPLATTSLAMADLPELLVQNPFVETVGERHPGWRLLLPEDVQLRLTDEEGERMWTLRHSRYGRITIRCFRHYWAVGRDRKVGRVLSEGLKLGPRSQFWVLGSRIEAVAFFRYTFLRRADLFHEWAAGLLACFEEKLDWGYFDRSRPHRMIVDLPWKIGDLPRPGDSLWNKLCEIEKRLTTIEADLSEQQGDV